MSTKTLSDEFIEILDQENAILDRVLNLAMEQQQSLIQFDADRIEQIAKEQEACAAEMKQYERSRIATLSVDLNITMQEASRLTLQNLCSMVDSTQALPLQTLRESMNSLTTKIQFCNNVNRVLALRGRNSVRDTFEFVRMNHLHVVNASL